MYKIDIDWTSISAVSSGATDAALKLSLALVMSYEFDYDSAVRRKINMWVRDSREFFKRFGFGTRESEAAANILVAQNHEENDKFDDLVTKLIDGFRTKKNAMKAEMDIDAQQLKMFNDIRLYFQKDSAAASRSIAKNVSMFRDTDLTAMFVEEIPDTSNTQKAVEDLVQKYGKTSGIQMPADVLKQWQDEAKKRGTKLPQHMEYLKLNRELRESFKTFLMTTVRASGKPYLPIHEIIHLAKEQGIPHSLPKGFRGNIDDLGRFYTTEGLLMKSSPTGDVVMNPAYDPKKDNAYVCKFKAVGGKDYLRGYTVDYVARQKKKNFGVVQDLTPKIKSLSNKWMVDVAKAPKSRNSVLACCLEFIYQTGARPGDKNQATKGQQTFGATQLRVSHIVKLDDDLLHVKYLGAKSTELTEYIVRFRSTRLKKFGQAMQRLVEGKSKDDYIFEYQGKPFSGAMLKRYMTAIGFPKEVSAKKLRTAKGTGMFMEAVKNSPFKGDGEWTDKQVNDWLNEQAKKVGSQLGHTSGGKITPNTAIQNYIDPFIIENFANKLGVRLAAKFLNAIKAAKGEK